MHKLCNKGKKPQAGLFDLINLLLGSLCSQVIPLKCYEATVRTTRERNLLLVNRVRGYPPPYHSELGFLGDAELCR